VTPQIPHQIQTLLKGNAFADDLLAVWQNICQRDASEATPRPVIEPAGFAEVDASLRHEDFSIRDALAGFPLCRRGHHGPLTVILSQRAFMRPYAGA
jgi:hypothetical protein